MYCLNLLEIALRARRARPDLRGHRHQVLRALRLHRVGHVRARACGTRRTASTTTCCTAGRRARVPLRVRSMVGLLPLCADDDARPGDARRGCPSSPTRLRWFLEQQAAVRRASSATARRARPASSGGCCRSSAPERLRRILERDARRGRVPLAHGLRSLSRVPPRPPVHARPRRRRRHASTTSRPSRRTGLFGGNSNWRGPVWFPVNYLLIEALRALPPLLRRRLHRRVPDRLGHASARSAEVADELARPAHRPVPRRRRRAAGPSFGGDRAASRPTRLARPAAVPRVLPRRHRRRPRRLPPDRLDRPGRRPHPAQVRGRRAA